MFVTPEGVPIHMVDGSVQTCVPKETHRMVQRANSTMPGPWQDVSRPAKEV